MADEATQQPMLTPGLLSINRGPWAALVDDDGSNTIGTPWTKQAIKDVILDPVDAAIGAVGGAAGSLVRTQGATTPGTGSAVTVDSVTLPTMRLGSVLRVYVTGYAAGVPNYLSVDAPGVAQLVDLLAVLGTSGWPSVFTVAVTLTTIDGAQWVGHTTGFKSGAIQGAQAYGAGPFWTNPGILLGFGAGMPAGVNLQWRWSVELVP